MAALAGARMSRLFRADMDQGRVDCYFLFALLRAHSACCFDLCARLSHAELPVGNEAVSVIRPHLLFDIPGTRDRSDAYYRRFRSYGGAVPADSLVFALCYTAVVLLLATASYRFIEVPAQRYLRTKTAQLATPAPQAARHNVWSGPGRA